MVSTLLKGDVVSTRKPAHTYWFATRTIQQANVTITAIAACKYWTRSGI
jgi:hypothetical protein